MTFSITKSNDCNFRVSYRRRSKDLGPYSNELQKYIACDSILTESITRNITPCSFPKLSLQKLAPERKSNPLPLLIHLLSFLANYIACDMFLDRKKAYLQCHWNVRTTVLGCFTRKALNIKLF